MGEGTPREIVQDTGIRNRRAERKRPQVAIARRGHRDKVDDYRGRRAKRNAAATGDAPLSAEIRADRLMIDLAWQTPKRLRDPSTSKTPEPWSSRSPHRPGGNTKIHAEVTELRDRCTKATSPPRCRNS